MGTVAVVEKVMGIITRLEDFDSSTVNIKTPNPGEKLLDMKRFSKYLKWYDCK